VTLIADVSDIDSITCSIGLDTFPNSVSTINNAGIAAFGKFLELEPKAWGVSVQVELNGYCTTQRGLTNMIERQTGDIINISSTAGLKEMH
jgi:3-oxoacyl-[acyl-carrier protein] reductase